MYVISEKRKRFAAVYTYVTVEMLHLAAETYLLMLQYIHDTFCLSHLTYTQIKKGKLVPYKLENAIPKFGATQILGEFPLGAPKFGPNPKFWGAAPKFGMRYQILGKPPKLGVSSQN